MVIRMDGRSVGTKALLATVGVLAALLLSVVTAGAASAAEAGGLSVSTMKVSIWPEYDDPRVLVIYQADLDDSVQLPADVTFNLPKGAEIGMACEVDVSGGHACKPFKLVDQGGYQSLTYSVEAQRKIFFEYYYDAFPAGETSRSFDLSVLPAFPVGELTLEVQEPARSTDFTVAPAFPEQSQDSQGLVYHLQRLSSPPVGEPIDLAVSYTKQDDRPSVSPSSAAAADGTTAAAGESGGGRSLVIVVVVVGLVAVGLVGYRTFRPQPASVARVQVRRAGPVSTGRGRTGGSRAGGAAGGGSRAGRGQKYCTECGTRLTRDARFCSECGHEQA